MSKDEIKALFTLFGNIPLLPKNYYSFGIIKEYYEKKNAFIINLEDISIKVGEELLFNKDNLWFVSSIKSIRKDDEDIYEATYGEVGIVIKGKAGKGYSIYKKLPTLSSK